MSVRYEITKTGSHLCRNKLKIWHDSDDDPVYDGVVGPFVFDNINRLESSTGAHWSPMKKFDDEFHGVSPTQIALDILTARRYVLEGEELVEDGDFCMGDDYFACAYGRYLSFENMEVLIRWLVDNVCLDQIVVWYAENHPPKTVVNSF